VTPRRATVRLTHYGRKSGKPYGVTIWFVEIDGNIWIGSLRAARSWVKNVRANGKSEIDFGTGPVPMRAHWRGDRADVERYERAIREKYPVSGRILGVLIRGTRCAFRLEPAER